MLNSVISIENEKLNQNIVNRSLLSSKKCINVIYVLYSIDIWWN